MKFHKPADDDGASLQIHYCQNLKKIYMPNSILNFKLQMLAVVTNMK
jgi:hypothetical protein